VTVKSPVVHSDPEILGGDPLDEFLDDFPSVTREQAVLALEQAKS